MTLEPRVVREIAGAAERLRAGELVCFPTETMYGIAADIRRVDALERLAQIKGRADTSPFGLIVSAVDHAVALASSWPTLAAELAAEHWPGALTLVVPARSGLPEQLVGPGGGVGVRLTSHSWAAALAREVGGPITATSANRSGEPAALDVDSARRYFGESLSHYLDAGRAVQETPSTVVSISETGDLRVLRPGAVDISSSRT